MTTTDEDRAAEEYKATLSELDSNSKVQINALTMLADENKDIAVRIASCIENQLKLASTNKKLPVLYLIDSIFSDEKIRRSLHKLKVTWNNTKIFPLKKLNAIDEKIHAMDPNWPLLHRPALQQPAPPRKRIKVETHTAQMLPLPQPPVPVSVPLQTLQPPQMQPPPALSQYPQPAPQPQLSLPPVIQAPPIVPIVAVVHETSDPVVLVQQQPQLESQPCVNSEPLPSAPILPTQITSFDPNIMPVYQPYMSILESLYGCKQCSNCSLRFSDNDRYANHLDWHFRKHLISDVFPRRKWYLPLNLWKKFRDINDDVLQENNNNTDNNVNDLLLPVNDNEMVPTAPAFIVDEKNICDVCHETFEKFWAEEEEEWRLKNAKLHDDERVYHPTCLIDMLRANNDVSTSDEQTV